jgi:ABC-type multidrug transport system permease subunit
VKKYILFGVAALFVVFAGLIVGYVLMGNRPLGEVLDFGTWKHLIDLVFAD